MNKVINKENIRKISLIISSLLLFILLDFIIMATTMFSGFFTVMHKPMTLMNILTSALFYANLGLFIVIYFTIQKLFQYSTKQTSSIIFSLIALSAGPSMLIVGQDYDKLITLLCVSSIANILFLLIKNKNGHNKTFMCFLILHIGTMFYYFFNMQLPYLDIILFALIITIVLHIFISYKFLQFKSLNFMQKIGLYTYALNTCIPLGLIIVSNYLTKN